MKEDETQISVKVLMHRNMNTANQVLLHNEWVFGLKGPRSELHGVTVGDQLIGWKSVDLDADLPEPKPYSETLTPGTFALL